MGTVERSTDRTGRTTSAVQPALFLVGAPGVGKTKIADTLARDYFTEKLSVHDTEVARGGTAIGLRSDYRTELHIATTRATQLHSTRMPVLYTHSLIDSLSYTLVRLDDMIVQGAGTDRQHETWTLTMATIGVMLRDTFKSDEIVFLKAKFDKDSDEAKIQEILGLVLDGFELSYTIIDVEEENAIDDIATVIESHLG